MKKPGRPLEYDPEEVLEAAMLLFWSKGYEAASLKDLLNVTKISKSSFYYAFGSKYQLFEQCIERFRNRQVVQMKIELEQSATGREFIEAFLYNTAKIADVNDKSYGYSIMNTTTEFAGRNPEVSNLIANATKRLIEVFCLAVKRGQSEGVICGDKDADTLAIYIMNSIAGLRSMMKVGVDPKKINNVVFVTLTALD
jgi:TetR/AcrR family transcriptional repressor of nem operon